MNCPKCSRMLNANTLDCCPTCGDEKPGMGAGLTLLLCLGDLAFWVLAISGGLLLFNLLG